MARGRVQLRRIENKRKRRKAFLKRRVALWKKAHELSVLFYAQVALFVFSSAGKLFQYSTDSRMGEILERYKRYFFQERQLTSTDQKRNWPMEFHRLKAKVELLEKNYSHYMGEDLDSLSSKELGNLEQQMETNLELVRSKKLKETQEQPSASLHQHQLPFLNIGGLYQDEGSEATRNDLDLTLNW